MEIYLFPKDKLEKMILKLTGFQDLVILVVSKLKLRSSRMHIIKSEGKDRSCGLMFPYLFQCTNDKLGEQSESLLRGKSLLSLMGFVITEPKCSFGCIQYKNCCSSFCWPCRTSFRFLILGCLFIGAGVISSTACHVGLVYQAWIFALKQNFMELWLYVTYKTQVHVVYKM